MKLVTICKDAIDTQGLIALLAKGFNLLGRMLRTIPIRTFVDV